MSTPSAQPVSVPERSEKQVVASPAPGQEKKPFTIKIVGGIPM